MISTGPRMASPGGFLPFPIFPAMMPMISKRSFAATPDNRPNSALSLAARKAEGYRHP